MSTPAWQPGTIYQPGAIVSPRSNDVVVSEQPFNNSWESGLTHWTVTGEHLSNTNAVAATHVSTAETYDGSQSVTVAPTAGDGTGPTSPSGKPVGFVVITNQFQAPVVPGTKIAFKCRFWHVFVSDPNQVYAWGGGARIAWFDASHTLLGYSYADTTSVGSKAPTVAGSGFFAFPDGIWVTLSGSATAPAGAAYAAAVATISTTDYASQAVYADLYTWDYTQQGYPVGLVFVAVQAAVGTSAGTEPIWPVTPTTTVVDNTVTWEAEFASLVRWTASSILTSGTTEPTWPLSVGGFVIDGDMEWVASDGMITDPNCPHSKIVTITSAKVFAADGDIIRFSATANAQDWSSSQDAGFIPFGLQAYGNENVAGLGLYRSNLVAFNSLGYQMWQVDPDPNNIAILDAEPVGCRYNRSIQPVNNDLVFLTDVGIRNIGTAGASGNLQAGQFGKQVDPIVKALIKLLKVNGVEPIALFYPGTGQYWIIMSTVLMVLTINGNSAMSWSQYTFPAVITDWTVMDGVLYVRAGDLVWKVSEDALFDDMQVTTAEGGTSTPFQGYMWWNYLDFGAMGVDKQMEGFDLVIGNIDDDGTVVNNNVTCEVVVGYNQSDPEQATDPYLVQGDSIPGSLIPLPLTAPSMQMRLDFGTGQDWGWAALNVYVKEMYNP